MLPETEIIHIITPGVIRLVIHLIIRRVLDNVGICGKQIADSEIYYAV